jgi:glutamine amidotransferase PdxT
MKTIKLYTGTGAYQAKDIENFLVVYDYDYERIDEHQFANLNKNSVLIVPGGEIAAYLSAWGTAGVQAIRDFVSAGGIYIGICAGAYIAGQEFEGTPGLNFVPQILTRNNGQKILDVTDKNDSLIHLVYENGPDLDEITADEIILKDETGKPQAIEINFGEGKVYLFAAHPEGSVYHKQMPQEFSGAKFFDKFLKTILL